MKKEDYLQNGMIEDYCLGMLQGEKKAEFEMAMTLFLEVKREVLLMQRTLNNYATAVEHKLNPAMESRIWRNLETLNDQEKMTLQTLPLINKYSDHQKWLEVVKPLLPDNVDNGRFMYMLQETPTLKQMLVMSKKDYDDEIHDDLQESFLVLEGECVCDFADGTQLRLSAGGYADVPMHITHNLRILSHQFIGVIQRVAV